MFTLSLGLIITLSIGLRITSSLGLLISNGGQERHPTGGLFISRIAVSYSHSFGFRKHGSIKGSALAAVEIITEGIKAVKSESKRWKFINILDLNKVLSKTKQCCYFFILVQSKPLPQYPYGLLNIKGEAIARENNGDIFYVNRLYLDELQNNLNLLTSDAQAVEMEVLEPLRKRQEKLHRYEQAVFAIVQRQYPISDSDRVTLDNSFLVPDLDQIGQIENDLTLRLNSSATRPEWLHEAA